MGVRLKRKLFKIGQSHAVTLPQAWVTFYGARVDEVTLIGGTLLIIAPAGLERQAEEIVAAIEKEV